MNLRKKDILLISPEPWDHIFVSKHHYATHLAAKGNKVYFLNPPSKQESCEETQFADVFAVNYNGLVKGIRFFPNIIQRYLFKRKFRILQKLCNTKFDVVWSFDNSVFFDFRALPKNILCISHIVDLNQSFEFDKSSKTADICLSTSKAILDNQLRYNINSFNIGHGFNRIKRPKKNFNIGDNSKINCGYAGNLDIQYIDWDLISAVVENFPQIAFHFAGQWKNRKYHYLRQKKNFHYHGILPANALQSYYATMDFLLILYKYYEFPKQLANPHKMMEYLGSGKMIVATFTEEYKILLEQELILMFKNRSEFVPALKKLINELTFWNSPEKIKKRETIAMANTYDNQIEKIESLLPEGNKSQ